MQQPPLSQDTLEKLLSWVAHHPWMGIPLIFYGVTALLSYKRDKSFWQVWFNGRTPLWMMGSKHKKRAIDHKIEKNKQNEEANNSSKENK